MKHTLLLVFAALLCLHSLAATVNGTIRNHKGDPLPFASVLVKNTTVGTTANIMGEFSIQLKPGNYVLVCKYVGYKSVEKQVRVGTDDLSLEIVLEEQQYNLNEVVVKSGSEDPAYAIIRNAIREREKHLNEIKRFQADVYIKGQLKLRDYPRRFMGSAVDFEDGDTSKRKMIFLSESLSRLSVEQPNKRKVEVLSTKVSGNSEAFGLADAQIISFYENIISLGSGLNPRGFISPISNNALNFYRYKFEGTYFENGKEINHIRVIPRREYEPLFHGHIDIVEGEWRIYSVQLYLLKTSQMQFLDTLKIDQLYVPASNNWVLKQQVIYPAGKIFGFDFHGSFVQVYDKYDLDPRFPRNFFNNTVIKIQDSATKKTADYWDSIRPIPLLEEEVKDYQKKDSLEQVRKDPRYLDSLDRKANKPSVMGVVLTGYNYSRRKDKLNVSFSPLLDMINFNTVEGAVINVAPTITKRYEGRRRLVITPTFRYGFSNQRPNAHVNTNYVFGKKYYNSLSFGVGRRVFQFNNAQPILPRFNTYSTLLWRNNFMKIYEAFFVNASMVKGLGDGFTMNAGIQYQNRAPLENTTDYSWKKIDNKPFTPNYPFEISNSNIPHHRSTVATIGFTWQPGAKYIETPDRKINLGSKYPTFGVSFSHAVEGLFGSDASFSKWRLTMNDNLNLKLGGRLNYRLATGGFLNADKVFLPDYIHYLGNQQSIASTYLNSFQLMTYYGFSHTEKLYATAHLEYHLNGLLTNKIPVIRKWNWFLVVGTNTLFINKDRYHAEVFAGVENIFKVMRIDFVQAFQHNNARLRGIRFSLPLIDGERD